MVMMVLSQFCIRAVNHVHVRRVQVGAGDGWRSALNRFPVILLARDAFVRTSRRAIAMMFVRLYLSVCLGRAFTYCDHMVHTRI